MQELCENLAVVLKQMAVVYRDVLLLGKDKKEVLVAGKVDALGEITRQEELCILQAAKLEKERERILAAIKEQFPTQQAASTLSLSEIIKETDADTANVLALAGEELRDIAVEIKKITEVNSALLKRAMAFVDYNINLLTHHRSGPSYAAQGQDGQSVQKRLLVDQKA